jgi:hypothetical protein
MKVPFGMQRSERLLPFAEKLANRFVDSVFVRNLRQNQVFVVVREFSQFTNEVAGTVRTLNLPVTVQVAVNHDVFHQDTEARVVVLAPVVAVGKLKAVDVPFGWWKLSLDEISTDSVG